jgi:protein disulfide-isomerase A6
VKVAAIDCDADENKPFCGSMGIKGFPTLKIVRPAMKKGNKPVVEDYNGGRTATDIVNAAMAKINNHVVKVTDKDVDKFLAEGNGTAKAVLFSDKGTTSALLKSVAIDFLGSVKVAQVRNKEAEVIKMFGVEKFPTLVLLPGGDKESVVYEGEMKKEAIVEFLSQAGTPNTDPAPAEEKKAKKSASSKTKSSKTTEASSATEETKASTDEEADQKPIVAEEPKPTATPTPIPAINTLEDLVSQCLTKKSHTCVLALVPSTHGENAKEALTSLSSIAFKHSQSKRNLFPFFEVAKENEGAAEIVKELGLEGEIGIIAINARRKWWRQYEDTDFSAEGIERWIDTIRMGEGKKNKLPEVLIAKPVSPAAGESAKAPEPEEMPEVAPESATSAATEEPAEEITPEAQASETVAAEAEETTETMPVDPEAETETAKPTHEEL